MEFYSMEQFEMMGDWMDEIAEWESYERDMESNPYDECIPTEDKIDKMFIWG